MLFDELAFPPHEGLPFRPGPPTIDGYVEPEPNILTNEIEGGYTNGSSFDFAGTDVPVALVQSIRHASQDLIYLGFVTRFDPSFDDKDFVMIVLRPNAAAGPSDQDRQLIVWPMSTNAVGASPAAPEINPGHIRTNRDPFVHPVQVRRRDTSAGTHPVWADLGPISNLVAKVRSASSGTGANFWSLEVQIPTKKRGAMGGGSDWIDLQSTFGLYLNIAQVTGMGATFQIVRQNAWPFETMNPGASALVDPFENYDRDWDAPVDLGKGLIVASQAANPAKGVKFQSGAGSIGVLSGGTIGTTLNMAVGAQNTLVGRLVNTADAPAAVEATFRLAEFGIPGPSNNANAAYLVVPATPNPTNPVNLTATAGGGTPVAADATLLWQISQNDHNTYQGLWDDQCLWVQLESASGANIVQTSVRRNLSLINQMSRVEKKATIDGRGYGPSSTGGGKHKVILHVASMPIPRIQRPDPDIHEIEGDDEAEGAFQRYAETFGPALTEAMVGLSKTEDVVGWVSFVNAYRDIGKHLTIDKTKHRVVIHTGSYGFIAQHQLEPGEAPENIELGHWLTGGGVDYKGGGVYELDVPEGGKVTLKNTLRQQPAGTGQDPPSEDPWWLRFLKWLIALIKRLFHL